MAYHEAVHLGQELTRKMDTLNDNDDENGSQSSDLEPGEPTDSKKLSVMFAEDAETAAPEITGKFKKLFDMSFMKNAKAKQQEKAREDAMSLLQEIREMEKSGDGSGSDEENIGAHNSTLSKTNKALTSHASEKTVLSAEDLKRKMAAKAQMESLFGNSQTNNPVLAVKVAEKPNAHDVQIKTDIADTQNPWLSSLSDIDKQLDKKGSKKRKKSAVTVSVPLVHEEAVDHASTSASTSTSGVVASVIAVTNTGASSNKIAKRTDKQSASGQNNNSVASVKSVKTNHTPITVTMESDCRNNNADTDVASKTKQTVIRKPLLQQRSQV